MQEHHRLRCSNCSFEVTRPKLQVVVINSNGEAVVCPHPDEMATATEATGMSWEALVAAKRVYYRYSCVCLACENADFYGPDMLPGRKPPKVTQASMFQSMTKKETLAHFCTSCGKNEIYPLGGYADRFGILPVMIPLALGLMSVVMFVDGLGDWMDGKGFATMLTSIAIFAIAAGFVFVARIRYRSKNLAIPTCPSCHKGALSCESIQSEPPPDSRN